MKKEKKEKDKENKNIIKRLKIRQKFKRIILKDWKSKDKMKKN